MSKYPVWWNTTITVYNRCEDPQTSVVQWHRHVVAGAFWKHVRDKMTVGEETLEVDKIVCRIRESGDFLEKHLWVQMPNDRMGDYFTLGRGDILVKGEVDDEVDEYSAGHRSTDLVGKYKELVGCMEVEAVSVNVGAGRCLPHYLAEGL